MLLLDVMNETFLVICHPFAFSFLSYHMCLLSLGQYHAPVVAVPAFPNNLGYYKGWRMVQ